MPYAFDRTLGALGRKPEQKQDIFAPQGASLTGGDPDGALRSDTSGDLTGAVGGTNTGEGVKQGNETASNAAVAANVGRVKSPANLGALRQSVDATKSKLQQEADSYVTGNTGATALSEDDKINLRLAVDPDYARGDESGFVPQGIQVGESNDSSDGRHNAPPGVKVSGPGQLPKNSLEHWSQQRPDSVKTVDPFKTDTTTANSTIESLGTAAGVQNLLRRSGGAEYNVGDAAFDEALLSQDQGFQREREDLGRAYGDLQKFGDELGGKTTERGQGAANTAYGQYLTDMRSQLEQMNLGYTNDAMTREKEIEQKAQLDSNVLRDSGGKLARDRATALKAEDRLNGTGETADFIDATGFDVAPYYTQNFNADQYGWQDYLGEDQAATFNNIMGLLGKGDTFKTGGKAGGLSGADLGAYDTGRLDADLTAKGQAGSAAAKQKAAEEAAAAQAAAQAQAAAEEAAAAEKAAADAAAIPGQIPSIQDWTNAGGTEIFDKVSDPSRGMGLPNDQIKDMITDQLGIPTQPSKVLKMLSPLRKQIKAPRFY